MALNIKDPETDRLVRELARLTGRPITAVVREAVEASLASEVARQRAAASSNRDLIDQIAARGRARPFLDDRTEDEILGYDENGLPS